MSHPFSLHGKVGIVTGLANEDSIALGCAQALHQQGAEMLVTYASASDEPKVLPLAEAMGYPELLPCDVQDDPQLDALFDRARERWGRIDFVVHSIAFAPLEDLHGRVVDSSRE
ncbi:SDR family oxidoreductase, partial [Halomonas sp.]|uniref:SDR family oxidoreductase n=1 Tax=Halomonas sp. TaxID=1486246 RepID=UPI0025C14DE1